MKLMPAQRVGEEMRSNKAMWCGAVSILCKHDDEQKKSSNLTPLTDDYSHHWNLSEYNKHGLYEHQSIFAKQDIIALHDL